MSPRYLLLVLLLLAGCDGYRCYWVEDNTKSVIVASDPVFQTVDIGAEPTHVRNSSWVEEIKVKADGSFRLITVQKHIRSDRTLGETRTLRILDLESKFFSIQNLPDGKKHFYVCAGKAGGLDFFREILGKI